MKQSKKAHNKRTFKHWPIYTVLVLALALSVAYILHFSPHIGGPAQQSPPAYETPITPPTSEINFADPEITIHTADDGVAVVNTAIPQARAARSVADPAEIWQSDMHTHGGFTLPVEMDGESIGVLTIPDIGLSVRVYEGIDEMEAMEKGVALFRHTSSWYGTVGLSAHNVNLNGTPGYFLHLYRLQPGAIIRYQTAMGVREYTVEAITEISQYDWSMLGRTEDNRITLITCITGQPNMRLAVQGVERLPYPQ